MKVNSNHHPTSFTKTHGKLFFNSNIVQSEKTDEYGTRTVFNYDQTEITKENETEIMELAGEDGEKLKGFKESNEHHFKNFKKIQKML